MEFLTRPAPGRSSQYDPDPMNAVLQCPRRNGEAVTAQKGAFTIGEFRCDVLAAYTVFCGVNEDLIEEDFDRGDSIISQRPTLDHQPALDHLLRLAGDNRGTVYKQAHRRLVDWRGFGQRDSILSNRLNRKLHAFDFTRF